MLQPVSHGKRCHKSRLKIAVSAVRLRPRAPSQNPKSSDLVQNARIINALRGSARPATYDASRLHPAFGLVHSLVLCATNIR
jgi:hypothetical protein